MAPCKPAKSLTVHVPRQNAQRIGPSLTAQVQTVGRQDNIIVHMPPPVQEQPGSAGPSSENASEWNSLLISARAQRGPFWDVGTQQFLVEKESNLYYDSTTLIESARSLTDAGQRRTNSQARADVGGSSSASIHPQHQHQLQQQFQQQQQLQHHHQQQQQQLQQLQQQQQQQQRNAYANQQYQYASSMHQTVPNHTTPVRNMPYPAAPPSAGGVHAGQYYGDQMTPTRPGVVDGVGPSPDLYGRRITRGMSDGYGYPS